MAAGKRPHRTRGSEVSFVGSERARPGSRVGDTVEIRGVSCRVVSERSAERAAMVVCIPWSMPLAKPDNLWAPCSGCGQTVQFRPHAPKRPPKMCVRCAEAWMRDERPAG